MKKNIEDIRKICKTVAIKYVAAERAGFGYEDVTLANIEFANLLVDFLEKGGKLEEIFKKE